MEKLPTIKETPKPQNPYNMITILKYSNYQWTNQFWKLPSKSPSKINIIFNQTMVLIKFNDIKYQKQSTQNRKTKSNGKIILP
jgi:hypothetical protein